MRARLLADPWTVGAGVFIGALATVGTALPVAIGVAAGVGAYAVGTAVKALTSRDGGDSRDEPSVELPPARTEARALYERARSAVGDLDDIAGSQRPGPVRDQAVDVARQAREALSDTARIAAQTVVLGRALARVDVSQARRDLERLEQSAGGSASHESSLAAVRSQLAVAGRLEAASHEAHSRLLATALGLESLVASLAEVVAMASGSGDGDAGRRIHSLADAVTGLRLGLAEAEETSRQALSA